MKDTTNINLYNPSLKFLEERDHYIEEQRRARFPSSSINVI